MQILRHSCNYGTCVLADQQTCDRLMTRRGDDAAKDPLESEIQGVEGQLHPAIQPPPSDSTVTATSTVVALEVLTMSLWEPVSLQGQGLLSTCFFAPVTDDRAPKEEVALILFANQFGVIHMPQK